MSTYLSWQYLVGGSVIGCGGEGRCDQVVGSRWSAVAGKCRSAVWRQGHTWHSRSQLFIGPSHGFRPATGLGAMQILAGAAAEEPYGSRSCRRGFLARFVPLHGDPHCRPVFGGFDYLAGILQFEMSGFQVWFCADEFALTRGAAGEQRRNGQDAAPVQDVSATTPGDQWGVSLGLASPGRNPGGMPD